MENVLFSEIRVSSSKTFVMKYIHIFIDSGIFIEGEGGDAILRIIFVEKHTRYTLLFVFYMS